ncbi:predicted protein [Uncinocarpus reesii 1704]|uniref:Uncharacterized protein n=1 Tax=Uncinocarpus reesii (strain UAMH 1704) TaxID=336963 RepID=C4JDU0_UNCRE|nr:uncharacterized protein UREG_00567 [Uncinocarpus reesii 1704]EEP75720.1 predicted protein [Uncinocarpus reesii 1704]
MTESFQVVTTFFQPSPGVHPGYFYLIRTASNILKYFHLDDTTPRSPDVKGSNLDFKEVIKGNWVVGILKPSNKTKGKFSVVSSCATPLKGIERIWTDRMVDVKDIADESEECVLETDLESYYTKPLVCKVRVPSTVLGVAGCAVYSRFPDVIQLLQRESDIYRIIQGKGLARRFLAYITEDRSRVIGFIVMDVSDDQDGWAEIMPQDIRAQQRVLRELHGFGIALGTVSQHYTFLELKDGRSLIENFRASTQNASKRTMSRELKVVGYIPDPIDRPNFEYLSEKLRKELRAIQRRDGDVHIAVIMQATKDGIVTVTEKDHKELLVTPLRSWNID